MRPILILGGAGFIGSNVAAQLAGLGEQVRVFDDLSRAGVEQNLAWLVREFGNLIEPRVADIRDVAQIRDAVRGVRAIFHFAAQTAVTASFLDPRDDFDVNVRGTIEVLEAVRALREPPPVIFTSTSKVYGCLPDLPLRVEDGRWTPLEDHVRAHGIDEKRPLDFRTPLGCSKGAADQYVLDYARSFAIPATVFRTSCIYGPHQFGTEDQGWVAHFLARAIEDARITIFGDGRQVRDVLFIDDLVEACTVALEDIDRIAGRAFNIGGGPQNTLSLLELLEMIERLRGSRPDVTFEGARPGDQRYYVSNTAAFSDVTGWHPRVGPRSGVEALYGWLLEQRAPVTTGVIHA